MIKHLVKITLRSLRTNKTYTFINIIGLAIGMTCTLLITVWVAHEMSYDKFHSNANRIYRVVENQYYADSEVFPVAVSPAPLAQTLKDEYSEVIHATRLKNQWWVVEQGDKVFSEKMGMIDDDFFKIFTVNFIEGNPEAAFNNSLSVVLTQETADKYFNGESALGKVLKINKRHDFTVSAVISKFPSNSHISFDILMPFDHLKKEGINMEEWGSNSFYTYVHVIDHMDVEAFNDKIKNVIKDHSEGSVTDIYLQPLSEIHLYAAGKFTADVGGLGDIQIVNIFIAIGIFILVIACINYMNLSTAKSVNRAREISIKKVMGSNKLQIIVQFLSESVFVSFIAYFVALLLAALCLPLFNELSGKNLSIPFGSYRFLGMSFFFILLIGLLSGSYPAFILSSFKPLAILKGFGATKSKGHASLRRILVVVQFTLSIFLIIGFGIISQQLNYIQNKKLGLDKDNVLFFYMSQNVNENWTS